MFFPVLLSQSPLATVHLEVDSSKHICILVRCSSSCDPGDVQFCSSWRNISRASGVASLKGKLFFYLATYGGYLLHRLCFASFIIKLFHRLYFAPFIIKLLHRLCFAPFIIKLLHRLCFASFIIKLLHRLFCIAYYQIFTLSFLRPLLSNCCTAFLHPLLSNCCTAFFAPFIIKLLHRLFCILYQIVALPFLRPLLWNCCTAFVLRPLLSNCWTAFFAPFIMKLLHRLCFAPFIIKLLHRLFLHPLLSNCCTAFVLRPLLSKCCTACVVPVSLSQCCTACFPFTLHRIFFLFPYQDIALSLLCHFHQQNSASPLFPVFLLERCCWCVFLSECCATVFPCFVTRTYTASIDLAFWSDCFACRVVTMLHFGCRLKSLSRGMTLHDFSNAAFRTHASSSATHTHTHTYTECNRRNGPDFGRVFLRSYYTDITQNTYIQSSMVNGDIGQRSLKLWQLLHTYWLPNTYWNWQEYVVSIVLISVHNIKVTCEWHKAIK